MARPLNFNLMPTTPDKKPLWVDDAANFVLGAVDMNNVPELLGSEIMSAAPGYENALNIGANPSSSATTNVTTLTLSINDTTDHVINATETTDVAFTVSGLRVNETTTVTFTDANNHQVSVDVAGNGSYSANLSALEDGTITSSLVATGPAGHTATAIGNAVTLDTDRNLAPTITVDAANPANVTLTIGGLEGDETGTVTFTDSANHQDAVNIGSNGNYSTDLSNLTNGMITYLLSVTDPAGNTTIVDPPITLGASGYADGSVNAAAGTPQHPNLLSGYQVRPAWQVAGVDYAVGVPSGTTLMDPTVTGNLPAGVAVDTINHLIRVTSSNVTLNGFDFSLHGGYGIYVQPGATDTVVENSNFLAGSNGVSPISTAIGSGNLTIQYCTIDGGGANTPKPFDISALVTYAGSGTFTFEYNWAKDFPQHVIEFNAGPGTLIDQFNLMEIGGFYTGAHVNFIQFNGSTATNSVINFNTVLEPQSGPTGYTPTAQGIQIYAQSGSTISNTEVENNIILAPSGPNTVMSYGIDVTDSNTATGTSGTNVLDGVYVQDNYMDMSGAFGPYYPPVGNGLVFTNNINMATGNQFTSPPGTESSNVTQVVASLSSGIELPGDTITFTINLNEVVLVTGAPTMSLNDGGTATYTGGSGTNALTFSYIVAATDSTVSELAITGINLPNGTTIKDAIGNAAVLSGVPTTFPGLQIDPSTVAAPVIASFSPDTGTVGDGITNANLLTLTGTAAASSTVNLYDGTALLGTATADATGAWSFKTATLVDGSHSLTATDTLSGATSAASAALAVTVDTVAPTAPVITSDAIVNTNQVMVTGTALDQGTAEAGDLIKIYDGSTLIGTTTTDATGAWNYTTAPLSVGNHVLTATVTDVAGNTSALSQAFDPAILPPAPAITAFSPDSGVASDSITDANVLTLTGSAAASSTVNLYDGTVLLGAATADGSGNWSFATATLVDGIHNFTATDTLSGTTSAASADLAVTVDTVAPTAPVIAGDTILNTNQVVVNGTALDNGTAEAGDLIKIYDGTTLLGTTTTDATGAWSYTSAPLSSGYHVLTATVTDLAGNTSALSQAFDPPIPPPAPAITAFSPNTGVASDSITEANVLTLTGTAEANTAVSIYDGSTLLGTTAVNSSGAWSFATAKLSDGTHHFTATDTDAAALTSAASSAFNVTVDTVAPTDVFTSDVKNSNGSFTLSGTALDNGATATGDTINIYDGTTHLGSTTVGSNGQWSFTTATLSNTVHTFTSTATDVAGNVGTSTGAAIYGTTGNNTLVSTTGNDIMTSSGGADTFVFNGSSFGKDVITDFAVQGAHHDIIQFSQADFNSFAAVLAHATQVGSNVLIAYDANDTVTLNNVQINKLTQADFHFV